MIIFTLLLCISQCVWSLEDFIDPTIYENKWGLYYVPKDHNSPAVNTNKKGEVWEEATLEYILGVYKTGSCIVHAGAYFGDMLPFFSRLAEPSCVWAFEPVYVHYSCAKETMQLNHLENVNLFQLALSDQNEQLLMETTKDGAPLGGGSHVSEKGDVEIGSITLDEILKNCTEPIGLIHLDLEGFEIYAIRGAKQTIEKQRPILILEVWDQNRKSINQELATLGYTHILSIDENCVFFPLIQIPEG